MHCEVCNCEVGTRHEAPWACLEKLRKKIAEQNTTIAYQRSEIERLQAQLERALVSEEDVVP